MIWTTWRQHRAGAGVAAFIVAALAAAMLVVGSTARDRARALGLPKCTQTKGDCSTALGALHRDFHSIPPVVSALIAVPLLAGMFWAAPLVSREYEAGTHRLAFTQSVSPLRWITAKIALIFTVLAAAALALGLLATWTLDPLTPAFGGRYNSTWYDVQSVVPVACMLFALAVGVAAGALIRRTIPAMAVTLLVYAAARIPVHFFRMHFAPIATRTVKVALGSLLSNPGGAPQNFVTSTAPPGAWVQSIRITDPAGRLVPNNGANLDILNFYCPNLQPTPAPSGLHGGQPPTGVLNPTACQSRLKGLTVHGTIRYQPASHFWLIQTVESAIFLAVAALLITAAVLAVTRRRPT
jgi:ABC-type transport system involved in multi-copper enzyme maturation permease subunit